MELCTTKALFGGASRNFCFSKKLQKPKASPNEVCYFQKQKLEKLILHCQSKSSSRAASRASMGEPFFHSFPSLLLHAVLDALPRRPCPGPSPTAVPRLLPRPELHRATISGTAAARDRWGRAPLSGDGRAELLGRGSAPVVANSLSRDGKAELRGRSSGLVGPSSPWVAPPGLGAAGAKAQAARQGPEAGGARPPDSSGSGPTGWTSLVRRS